MKRLGCILVIQWKQLSGSSKNLSHHRYNPPTKKKKKAKAIRILENRQRLIVNKQALNEESVDLKNLRKAFQHFIYFCFHLAPQLGNHSIFFFFFPNSIHPLYCKSNQQIRKCSGQQPVFFYVGHGPLVLERAEQILLLRTESVCSDHSEHYPKD